MCDLPNQSVKTILTNLERRSAIRGSWGNSSYYNDYPVKLLFLLGLDTSMNKKTNIESLNYEYPYDDILLGDFNDSFHNLTYKGSF